MAISMKISVIIPCHNAGPWIADALKSIATQTYHPHEVIVVDDSSNDDSIKIVKRTGIATHIIQVRHRNAAAARNAGIDAAQGNWIAFLDADNRWYSHHLATAAELLNSTTDVAYMAYPGTDINDSKIPSGPVPISTPMSGLTHDVFLNFRVTENFGFPTTGQILNTDIVREVKCFDVSQIRRHDFELFMRVIHDRTWTFNPQPSWWGRPPRPGDISADRVKCNYFALRAFILNETRYEGPLMRLALTQAARRAVVSALLEGKDADVDQVWQLAKSRLTFCDRSLLRLARFAPSVFRWLHTCRAPRK